MLLKVDGVFADKVLLQRAIMQAMKEIPESRYQRPYARKVAQRTAELYAYYIMEKK